MADDKIERTATESAVPEIATPVKPKRNRFAFSYAIIASMTSVLLGYDSDLPEAILKITDAFPGFWGTKVRDIGVMSGAAIFVKKDLKLSDVEIEVLVGILNLYSLVGSALAGRTSDWIGRRLTIILAAVIFFVGAVLMGLATNYAFLMVGRFVAGIGVGYALMIAPVYTAELAPASSRGFLSSFPEVFINSGIMLGYVSNYAFSKLSVHLGWRLMLGIGAIPSIFLGVGVWRMPESPRWLILQGRLAEGKKVLEETSESKEEVAARLADIKEAAGIPQSCDEEKVQVQKLSHGEGVWKELLLLPTPAVRRILVAAIGIHFFQQSSGIDAIVLYSPRIFEKAGIKKRDPQLGATVAVGFTKTLTILIATFLVDKIGRRPLLLFSVGGMIAALLALASCLTVIDNNPDKTITWAIVICILMVLAYVSFFSIGLGPITWVYSSEIFPLRLRAQGVSMGVAINRVTSGVLTMTFISLYKKITIGGAFYLFAGIATAAWLFFYGFLPETRGRTLEDTQQLFEKSNWRKAMKESQGQEVQLASNSDRP